jgi:outer membrane protein TolC
MRNLVYVFIFLVVFLPRNAPSQEVSVTLKDLEQEALNNNPEIGMAGKKAEAAEERKSLASAMPDPMVGVMIQNVGALGTSTVGKEEMSMQGAVFTQRSPFPGKLSTAGLLQKWRGGAENSRETRLRVLNNLRTAYYEYFLAYRSAEILNETKELAKI